MAGIVKSDYVNTYIPINIHVRPGREVAEFVTGRYKGAGDNISPFNGPDLIFASNGSDIVFDHKFYTRITIKDANPEVGEDQPLPYPIPSGMGELKGKMVLAIEIDPVTGEKNLWVRDITEDDIPDYLPDTTVGYADGLSHTIDLFGNSTNLYYSKEDKEAGKKSLVFDTIKDIKYISADDIVSHKNLISEGKSIFEYLIVSDNTDPKTYLENDWHLIVSKSGIDIKGLSTTTDKPIYLDSKLSYREVSHSIPGDGSSVKETGRKEIADKDLIYFEGTARLAQQLESPIHIISYITDSKTHDNKDASLYGEVYINGSKDPGVIPDYHLKFKNKNLFSSVKTIIQTEGEAAAIDKIKHRDQKDPSKDTVENEGHARSFVLETKKNTDDGTILDVKYDYIRFDDIVNRPFTLKGYGITDAASKTDLQKEKEEREKADKTLQDNLDKEKETREKTDKDLQDSIDKINDELDKSLKVAVTDNVVAVLNKYILLQRNIDKLSNIYFKEAIPDVFLQEGTYESWQKNVLPTLDSLVGGYAMIDEDIHRSFKETVVKSAETIYNEIVKKTDDLKKAGVIEANKEADDNELYKDMQIIEGKEISVEDITFLNTKTLLLDKQCDHIQTELYNTILLDTKRQLQYDIFPEDNVNPIFVKKERMYEFDWDSHYSYGAVRPVITPDSLSPIYVSEKEKEDIIYIKSLYREKDLDTGDSGPATNTDISFEVIGDENILKCITVEKSVEDRDSTKYPYALKVTFDPEKVDSEQIEDVGDYTEGDEYEYHSDKDKLKNVGRIWINVIQDGSGDMMRIPIYIARPKRVHSVYEITIEPWDNITDVSGIAEKFFGKGTAYEGDKLVENMTLEDGILKMPKEDNNQKHDGGYEPIEYEIGLTTDTDYVPIKITWKGQYPTIRKKNPEDEWKEVYDLSYIGWTAGDGDGYYYKQVGSSVRSVGRTNLGDKQEIPQDVFKYAHNITSFYSVFNGCSNLASIPKGLFNNNTAVTDFTKAFAYCSSLTSIPEGLFDNNTAVTSFNSTFNWCSSLTSIPKGLFDNNTAVTSFDSTFILCSSLNSIPEGLFDNNTAVTSFDSTFDQCPGLTSIPKGLFDNNTAVTSFNFTFRGCTGLTSIPEGLFDNNTAVTSFNATFVLCSSLTFIPEGLFDNNTAVTSFSGGEYYAHTLGAFGKCVNLTGSTPTITTKDGHKYKLWELASKPGYAKEIIGIDCFYQCTKLDDYNDIPAGWK